MATFQLTDQGGATYEIEAPSEQAAVAALMQATGKPAAPKEATPSGEFKLPVRSLGGDLNDLARSAANGVTFGLADRFSAKMRELTGIGGEAPSLSGDTGNDYASNLKREQARTDKFAEEQPIANAAANIAGGVMGPLGAIGAASRATTLLGKTAIGALTGGAIGGLQGGLGSRDYTDLPQVAKDTAIGAGGGALIGGAIPGGARVIGSGIQKVADAINGGMADVSRGASRHILSAVNADGVPAVQAQLDRLGPQGMLADAGPALLGKAQGASLNSDEGRSILQNSLTARNTGTNARISDDVNRALGPAEDPQTVTNAIRKFRSDTDAVNYPAALNHAPAVDTGGLLANLGPMIGQSVGMEKKALENLRGMLMTEKSVPRLDPQTGVHMTDAKGNPLFDKVPTPQTDPQILHKIKGEIDNVVQYDQPGLGIPAAALSRQQGALKHIRSELNGTLEAQVPGYAEANAKSAALAKRGEAVDAGTQYLGSGKTTASPDRFATEFSALAPGEQIAFAKGSRGNIDRILGTKANDLQALRGELQGEGGWNTAKIGTVHGQDAADQLVNSVDQNLKFRDTYNKVVENSQTAQRQAAAAGMRPTPPGETPLINPNMSLTGLVGTGAKKVAEYAINSLRRDPTAAYAEVAKILSAQGPQRDAHFQAIVDAMSRRSGNEATAKTAGDSTALIAAILANASLRNDPNKKPERALQ